MGSLFKETKEGVMYGGYTGKILWVDLKSGKCQTRSLTEELAVKWVGGAGLAAKIVWDETTATTEPFSADNPLVFMTGPVTGTRVPSSGRWVVAAISPLTDIWGQAHAGGTWGYSLKLAGWDGVVVTGIPSKPAYIWIDGDEVALRDASHLWGKDTWETDDLIKQELGEKVSVAAIGQAGERLVRFSGILSDGKLGRFVGRCGLGAVMGSKKLKAIAVRGNRRPKVHDEEGLKRSVATHFIRQHMDAEQLKYRRIKGIKRMWNQGRFGIKNYQAGEFEGFDEKYAEEMTAGQSLYCTGCSASCIESKIADGKRHMVGEHIACLGARCMIKDMEAIAKAYDLCNQYGMESMSVGGVVAFVMELYEKGVITREDTGGIDLSWGNSEATLAIVRQIGEREGFGRLLGEGVRRASEHIGGLASEYAMHVKGHEAPMYDLRSWNAGALEYATASSGMHHMEAFGFALSLLPTPFFGGDEIGEIARERFAVQGVGRLIAQAQDYGSMLDSMVVCKLLLGFTNTGQVTQPEHFLEWLNLVTGWQMNLEDLMRAGERMFNLKRIFNVRRGISRKDDTLPMRFLTHKRGIGEGGTADNLPPLGIMLNEYYAHRGWSEEGVPTKEKLRELDLEELSGYGL